MLRRTGKIALIAGSALLAIAAGDARAQVAGTYEWEMDMMIRRGGDGTETSGDKAKVKLVLEVKGDSVFGTYAVTPPAGAGSINIPPRQLKGTVSGNKVVFTMTGQARLNVNGEEQTVQMVSTYNATVEGDEIKGTIDVSAPEMPMAPPQRSFSGKRVKA